MELTAPLTDVPKARMAVASAVRTGDEAGERRARAILAASVLIERMRRTATEYGDELSWMDGDTSEAIGKEIDYVILDITRAGLRS